MISLGTSLDGKKRVSINVINEKEVGGLGAAGNIEAPFAGGRAGGDSGRMGPGAASRSLIN